MSATKRSTTAALKNGRGKRTDGRPKREPHHRTILRHGHSPWPKEEAANNCQQQVTKENMEIWKRHKSTDIFVSKKKRFMAKGGVHGMWEIRKCTLHSSRAGKGGGEETAKWDKQKVQGPLTSDCNPTPIVWAFFQNNLLIYKFKLSPILLLLNNILKKKTKSDKTFSVMLRCHN
jgi:hypothetical protein